MIYLACDSIPDQLEEKTMISSFAKIQEHEKKKKKKRSKFVVRVRILVNPASNFSNRRVLRFPPEKL